MPGKKQICFVLCAMVLPLMLLAQPKQGDAFLQINPGGHLSQISEAVTTPDGRFIITSSTDKTICIWDVEKKQLAEQIRGPKSTFNKGKVYALAVSPDGRLLATGGFFTMGKDEDYLKLGRIRIYDLNTRKQVLSLEAHQNVVTALRFSADGRFLLSGASDSTLICWKIERKGEKVSALQLRRHIQNDLLLEDIQTSGNSAYVTEQKIVVKYSLPGLLIKAMSLPANGNVLHIAVNQAKNTIAYVTREGELIITDTLLKRKQEIQLESYSNRVIISPDGNTIITEDNFAQLKIFRKDGNRFTQSLEQSFSGGATMLGMGFLNKTTFYVAGGNLNQLEFYSIEGNGTGKIKVNSTGIIAGNGRTFNRVNIDSSRTLLSLNDDIKNNAWNDYRYHFNLNAGRLLRNESNRELPGDTSRKQTSRDSISLLITQDYQTLYIYTNDEKTGTIKRDGTNGYNHNVYTITAKNFVVSGSAAGFLNVYDSHGNMLAELVGHESDIMDIAESFDGNFLYSVSNDQTTRMWDLREITGKLHFKQYSLLPDVWKEYILQNVPGFDSTRSDAVENAFYTLRKKGDEENTPFLIEPQRIEPRVNLFVSKDNEWVMWNNKGYFKASSRGANYIGWYVYQGEESNASFYAADKFYNNYYRPELINELAFTTKNEKEIFANVSNRSIAQQVSMMPEIRLINTKDTATIFTKKHNLIFSVTNRTNLGELVIYQNGKRLNLDTSVTNRASLGQLAVPVELSAGENIFTVTAVNKERVEGKNLRIRLTYPGAQPTASLYILTIGVDKYKNSRYNLNYAKADAGGTARQINRFSRNIFSNIYVDSLFDEKATAENVRAAFAQLSARIQPQDVFIFYFAGHGIMNEDDANGKKEFYLVLHNVTQMMGNTSALQNNGFSAGELRDSLLNIKAQKQLVLLDACNSGGAMDKLSRGAAEEAAIFQLARSTGFTVLSSTNQDQLATEVGQLGHGIFTYALLNGLGGEADIKKDGRITVKEIELYLNDIIPVLSEKYKGSQQFPQAFSRGMDFPITTKE